MFQDSCLRAHILETTPVLYIKGMFPPLWRIGEGLVDSGQQRRLLEEGSAAANSLHVPTMTPWPGPSPSGCAIHKSKEKL
jgi:hypothetical protein